MSGNDCQVLWALLNGATGEVLDARRSAAEETERRRLRAALVLVRKAEEEILRQLGAGEGES